MKIKRGSSEALLVVYDCEEDERDLFLQYAKEYELTLRLIDEPVTIRNAQEAAGAICVSVSHRRKITPEILSVWKRGGIGYVSTRSVGYNHIDMAAAAKLGLIVENVAYSPDSVADHTLLLMLASLREMKKVVYKVRMHDFTLGQKRSLEMRDLTVGVVGTGRIGQAVIKRLQAFGCRVLVYDLHQSIKAEYATYETLLRKCDIISYHIPLSKETKHMLNRQNIRLLKDGCYIINTARGALIENEALISAIKSGKVSGAALDVVENDETYFYHNCTGAQIDSQLEELCALSNCIVTPHMAFHTVHALQDMVHHSVENCAEYVLREKKLENII